jgi:hypothetical protein
MFLTLSDEHIINYGRLIVPKRLHQKKRNVFETRRKTYRAILGVTQELSDETTDVTPCIDFDTVTTSAKDHQVFHLYCLGVAITPSLIDSIQFSEIRV